MFDLSIVIKPNEARSLERLLAAVVAGTACDYELIIPSCDESVAAVLQDARATLGDRLRLITSRSVNNGLGASLARNTVILSQESIPLPGALDRAVELIDSADAGVAFLALFHRVASPWSAAYEIIRRGERYHLPHLRGTLCAHLPIGRTQVFGQVDFLNENLASPACMIDLSLKAWNAGMRVLPAFGCAIDGSPTAHTMSENDHRAILSTWDLPAANLNQNEFDPVWPCTLRGLKSTAIAA